MKVLAIEREVPGVTAGQFTAELLREEARAAWALHQAGLIRELYFSADQHDAVLILECSGAEEAQKCLSELPLVRAGLIRFDVMALVPYDGFARLFDPHPVQ